MKFLADENFPMESVRYLRRMGYDIQTITETHPGISDATVIQQAREQQRTILTFDLDFGEIVFKQRLFHQHGIVLFRFLPYTPVEPGMVFEQLLRNPAIQMSNYFTVVHRDHVRQRIISDN